jgi:transcriptional regulator with XRE-family HTH domain
MKVKINCKKIRDILFDNKMTLTELSKKAKIEKWQASQIVNGKKSDMFLSTAIRIATVLNTSLDEIFREEKQNKIKKIISVKKPQKNHEKDS